MNFRALLTRWSAGRSPVEAIIYYDGPRTRWSRARSVDHFEEHPGGLRIPIRNGFGGFMPAPHEEEVLAKRQFSNAFSARVWVLTRLKGLDTSRVVGEVRPL